MTTVVPIVYAIYGNTGCFATDSDAMAFGTASIRPGVVMVNIAFLPLVPLLSLIQHQPVHQIVAFLMDLLMMTIIAVEQHSFRIRSTQGRLGRLFIFQGFAVFTLMSALNLGIACNYLSTSREFNGTLMPIIMTLSNVLACRLTLSLRKRVLPTETYELRRQSRVVREALRRAQTEQA
ncbi:hypothetical protein V5O48_000839 [Marasmius crinis-equi]|uniref:Uncharacterized protein n=1 Tax=Marasmius crinis-equi TaxID=585013 RepID=A0ABR3G000_9AGAR